MADVWLLTAPGEAADLVFLLEDSGHRARLVPAEPRHAGLRAAAEQVHRFRWVAGASARAVWRLLESVSEARTRAGLAAVRWLVCDERGAAALERRGLFAQRAEPGDLGATLAAVVEAGDEVLVVRDDGAELRGRAELISAGASLTEVLLPAAPSLDEPLASVTVVHSVIAAERLADLAEAGALAHSRVIAGAPAVAAALESMGLPVHGVAASAEAWAVAQAALGALAPS